MIRLLPAVILLTACNSASVSTGVDYSSRGDYECQSQGISHVAVSGEVYRSPDDRLSVLADYARQTCALNFTGPNVDSGGIEARYQLWNR